MAGQYINDYGVSGSTGDSTMRRANIFEGIVLTVTGIPTILIIAGVISPGATFGTIGYLFDVVVSMTSSSIFSIRALIPFLEWVYEIA